MKPAFFLLLGALFFSGCSKKNESTSAAAPAAAKAGVEEEYLALMNSGKNYLEKGSAPQAAAAFEKAVKLAPTEHDAHLNLANAHLLAGNADAALKSARDAIALDNNSAAAHFVAGCALNRLGQALEAVKELQTSRDLDPTVAATSFQLGMARLQLKQNEEAITDFQATLELEPDHASAHYNLSQAFARSGREVESKKELEAHQAILAKNAGGPPPGPATFEKSKHTEARVPFKLEQPAKDGVTVAFTDQTELFFKGAAGRYSGPVGIIDIDHRGANDLFVMETGKGFRLLLNKDGSFPPATARTDGMVDASDVVAPGVEGNKYRKILVADLQQDRMEDVLALGDKGIQVFKFATNGFFMDFTQGARLQGVGALDGALADFDFTGKLDLMVITTNGGLRHFRNLGNMLFRDITATSGIPTDIKGARQIIVDDWNGDDILDVAIARDTGEPALLQKPRGGPLALTNAGWSAGAVVASGDLNNDLRIDTAIAAGNKIEIVLNNVSEKRTIDAGPVRILKLLDYDNDGWLDLLTVGESLRVWRNVGKDGFVEMTAKLGLKDTSGIEFLEAADFDNDGDSDLLLSMASGGLRLLRNDGGNSNHQLKLRLFGNRSNASGLGVKLELQAGGLRTIRTVQALPIEIGTGKYDQLETCTVRWFDLAVPSIDLKVEKTNIVMAELVLPTGSCPYLYVWDGSRHRFVTDILGAAPVGLPVAEGHYIEADPDEFVWVGNESNFQPLRGSYQMQITEELREVLYLDEAKLAVVDHPAGTEVVSTDKLVPGKPFPPSALMTLGARKPLLAARTLEGADVTEALQAADRVMVSPAKLHIPQRRGMAERHGVELEFGPLPVQRPLVLALTGWLRFGGGMANIAASQYPDLPFPFPILEVEKEGQWEPVRVTAGAPAGKTKTIVIDLEGKLPPGAHKLRLSAGFEIHWDRIALFEKVGEAQTRVTMLAPDSTDLHWRGFSAFENLPWTQPLTPQYESPAQTPLWRLAVSGWCTRYGAVDELVAKRDDSLALINGGDELTLRFAEKRLPEKGAGVQRDFFLYADGWDKDADFHVAEGSRVEPMPFHSMNDQLYGTQPRPTELPVVWMKEYNTRWVGPEALKRTGTVAKRSER